VHAVHVARFGPRAPNRIETWPAARLMIVAGMKNGEMRRGPFASSDYVFDFSAAMSCEVFKPRGVDNACFTRYDVKYRVGSEDDADDV